MTRTFLAGAVILEDIEYVVTHTPEDEKGSMVVVALFQTFCDASAFAEIAKKKLATSGHWEIEEITD